MIAICALFVFAMCTSYSVAAQNPNLLEQMEGNFNELSKQATSWSVDPAPVNHDTNALDDYDFGLGSDCADWVLEPQDGYIDIVDAFLPTGDIPLCIDQLWLDQFYVAVDVCGGYELLDMCLWLEQKGMRYCVNIVILRSWKDADCCALMHYVFGLELPAGVDQYCFDANNFPTVGPDFTLTHNPDYDDLQKEIYAHFCSLWTGCQLESQEFLISEVHHESTSRACVTFSMKR
jgi:hypothetical protein